MRRGRPTPARHLTVVTLLASVEVAEVREDLEVWPNTCALEWPRVLTGQLYLGSPML